MSNRAPAPQPRPNRAPGTVPNNRAPAPHPLRGARYGARLFLPERSSTCAPIRSQEVPTATRHNPAELVAVRGDTR